MLLKMSMDEILGDSQASGSQGPAKRLRKHEPSPADEL